MAHIVTIISEMAQAMSQMYDEHHKEHGLDVRINLALARQLKATDYLTAQRIRTRMINNFNHAFQQVDMILTPTTGIVAPPIKSKALHGYVHWLAREDGRFLVRERAARDPILVTPLADGACMWPRRTA